MKTFFRLSILLLSVFLGGCVSSGKSVTTDYYLLSAPPLPDQKISHSEIEVILLGPISFADYLKRPSMIKRDSKVKVNVSTIRQWAGNIEDEFQIALVKNFASLDARYLYASYPSMLNTKPAMQLRVNVLRFDAQLNGEARLEAVWAWLNPRGEVVAAGNFSRMSGVESTYASAAAAMSALLQQFTRDVHQALASAFPQAAGS